MDATTTGALILEKIGDFGTEMILVVGASLGLTVAFLVVRKGISWLKKGAK